MIVYTDHNVKYLPLPNRVEIVITDELAPVELTRTAFLIPVADDGAIILAHNVRRGWEIPGGHIEPGETMEEAAIRECFEETGTVVTGARTIGYLRMVSDGEHPEHWRYPHPISYQQFFAARAVEMIPYAVNDECIDPVRLFNFNDPRVTRQTIRTFGEHALKLFA